MSENLGVLKYDIVSHDLAEILYFFQGPAHIVTDVNQVSDYLTVRKATSEKLLFPDIDPPQNTDNLDGVR